MEESDGGNWGMDGSMKKRETYLRESEFIACGEWPQNNAISKRVAFGQATATGVESEGTGIGWNQVDISKSGMGGRPLSDQAPNYGHCLVVPPPPYNYRFAWNSGW